MNKQLKKDIEHFAKMDIKNKSKEFSKWLKNRDIMEKTMKAIRKQYGIK